MDLAEAFRLAAAWLFDLGALLAALAALGADADPSLVSDALVATLAYRLV